MILSLGTTPTVQRSMIFERVTLDDVNRALVVREYASGKSPNVARVLRTLGENPLAVGFAGGDRGKFLLEDLARAGVWCDFISIPSQTRLCTTVIDRAAGIATELVEEHAVVAPASWAEMDRKLKDLLPSANVWIFSGSLPPGAPADFYARWVPLARELGVTLILDTRSEPMTRALPLGGFIAKMNRDELAATVGRAIANDVELIAAARQIVPSNGNAIITLGSRGALASDGRDVWRVTPPKVKAISAVGSGDAFAAGLGLSLSRGATFAEALPLAAACGAANAMTAWAGHLSADVVAELVREVKVTRC
jgi:tagatose 6-phosphate kinase